MHQLLSSVPALALILFSFLLIAFAAKKFSLFGIGEQTSFIENLRRKPLLTDNEKEFFSRLRKALPQHHVFPQVAFNALLMTNKNLSPRDRYSLRNRFDRKYADFVICRAETFEVVAIVELDDKTHIAGKDEKRDALLKSAGYRIERFQSRNKPSEAKLIEIFGI